MTTSHLLLHTTTHPCHGIGIAKLALRLTGHAIDTRLRLIDLLRGHLLHLLLLLLLRCLLSHGRMRVRMLRGPCLGVRRGLADLCRRGTARWLLHAWLTRRLRRVGVLLGMYGSWSVDRELVCQMRRG